MQPLDFALLRASLDKLRAIGIDLPLQFGIFASGVHISGDGAAGAAHGAAAAVYALGDRSGRLPPNRTECGEPGGVDQRDGKQQQSAQRTGHRQHIAGEDAILRLAGKTRTPARRRGHVGRSPLMDGEW